MELQKLQSIDMNKRKSEKDVDICKLLSKIWGNKIEKEIKQERQTLINLKLDYFHVTGEMYGSDEVHQP